MTIIRHHLTDDLLMRYAAGTLHEAFCLVIATHVTLCDECRARLAGFDALGGAVLDRAAAADMARDSLDATLQRIAATPATATAPDRAATAGADDSYPAPLSGYAGNGAVRWRGLGLGVRQAILPTAPGARARLLHIPPGRTMPGHGHRGLELTLVMRGAYADAGGRYGPGDIEIAGEETEHVPMAEAGDPCICITATDAPLRFRALMPRMMQRLARI